MLLYHYVLMGFLSLDVAVLFAEYIVLVLKLHELEKAVNTMTAYSESSWINPTEKALHYISFSIISIFLLELIIRLIWDWRTIYKTSTLVDIAVIIPAFILEFFVFYADVLVILLIPGRIFRFVRLWYAVAD
jgi:hypothetical protein